LSRSIRADDVHVSAGDARAPTRVDVVIALALAAAVVVTYAPVVGYQFINYDDPSYVAENPHVTAGLTRATVEAATQGMADGVRRHLTGPTARARGGPPPAHQRRSRGIHARLPPAGRDRDIRTRWQSRGLGRHRRTRCVDPWR